jgi:hypothetical protein
LSIFADGFEKLAHHDLLFPPERFTMDPPDDWEKLIKLISGWILRLYTLSKLYMNLLPVFFRRAIDEPEP